MITSGNEIPRALTVKQATFEDNETFDNRTVCIEIDNETSPGAVAMHQGDLLDCRMT